MKKLFTTSIAVLLGLSFLLPSGVQAKEHKHKSATHVIIKHGHKHRPHLKPHHPRPPHFKPSLRPHRPHWYARKHLPAAATFAVIAGITYAIVDNQYYRSQGDNYVYVEKPQQAHAPQTSAHNVGSIVEKLPINCAQVQANGVNYYYKDAQWYLPIEGSNRFVIVAPPA